MRWEGEMVVEMEGLHRGRELYRYTLPVQIPSSPLILK